MTDRTENPLFVADLSVMNECKKHVLWTVRKLSRQFYLVEINFKTLELTLHMNNEHSVSASFHSLCRWLVDEDLSSLAQWLYGRYRIRVEFI